MLYDRKVIEGSGSIYLTLDPDPDPGGQKHVDPDPDYKIHDFYISMSCSTLMSYFHVGLDYVKDRWAFQKEDGSEHKEHTSMRAFKRLFHEIFVLFFSLLP